MPKEINKTMNHNPPAELTPKEMLEGFEPAAWTVAEPGLYRSCFSFRPVPPPFGMDLGTKEIFYSPYPDQGGHLHLDPQDPEQSYFLPALLIGDLLFVGPKAQQLAEALVERRLKHVEPDALKGIHTIQFTPNTQHPLFAQRDPQPQDDSSASNPQSHGNNSDNGEQEFV
jgi:hypothetical protein